MSEDRVGTGGQPSARPDGGSPDRQIDQPARQRSRRLPRSRLTWAVLALGMSFMLVAVGVVVGHAMGPKAATAPSASADTQAGNMVGGSVLTGAEPLVTGAPPELPAAPTPTSTPSTGASTGGTPAPATLAAAPLPTLAGAVPSAPDAGPAPSIGSGAPQGSRAAVPGQETSQEPAAATMPIAAADPDAAKALAIRIPRLGVNQSMIALHVQWDRSLSVPKSFSDIGWWAEGPAPAAPGAVIVGAHVSSKSGPGVFFKLNQMRKGDMVEVDRSDGTTAVFQVRGMASYPRDNYPNDIVYRTTGKASIHLITCDGAFDSSIGHHRENLVVFADLVSTVPTKEKSA